MPRINHALHGSTLVETLVIRFRQQGRKGHASRRRLTGGHEPRHDRLLDLLVIRPRVDGAEDLSLIHI